MKTRKCRDLHVTLLQTLRHFICWIEHDDTSKMRWQSCPCWSSKTVCYLDVLVVYCTSHPRVLGVNHFTEFPDGLPSLSNSAAKPLCEIQNLLGVYLCTCHHICEQTSQFIQSNGKLMLVQSNLLHHWGYNPWISQWILYRSPFSTGLFDWLL